jgi:tRNA threonylcarbamoyladenosine biosynthesis protein TsaB
MNILAFDTCFDACSVCVAEKREGVAAEPRDRIVLELASARERFETGHAERLVPMIDEVMAKAGVAFDALAVIAVTVGPGTFTGTRIGVAAARALTLTTGLGVVGVSSLAVMADMAADELGGCPGGEDLAVAVDARRGEVYVQLFAASALTQKSQPMLLSIEEAARLGGEGALLVVGSGGAAVAEAGAREGRRISAKLPDLLPDASALAQMAPRYAPGKTPPAPFYLRAPDAKPQEGKSIARSRQ